MTDDIGLFIKCLDLKEYILHVCLMYYEYHAYTTVEGAEHLFLRDPAFLLQETKDRWDWPTIFLDYRLAGLGEYPGYILQEGAACDMYHPIDSFLLEQVTDYLGVYLCGRKEYFT